MAHEKVLNVPLTFRFIRIPTTWRILDVADAEKEQELKGGWWADAKRLALGRIQFGAKATTLDGWLCRDEFFRLPQTEEALLGFLKKTGLWWLDYPVNNCEYVVEGRIACEPSLIPSVEEIWEFREELKQAIKSPAQFIAEYAPTKHDLDKTGRPRPQVLRFEFSGDIPKAIFPAITCQEILLATIYADLIQGFRFKFCKRKDCGLPFAVTSDHKRVYCTQYCGHLESLRKKRRNEANERRRHEK